MKELINLQIQAEVQTIKSSWKIWFLLTSWKCRWKSYHPTTLSPSLKVRWNFLIAAFWPQLNPLENDFVTFQSCPEMTMMMIPQSVQKLLIKHLPCKGAGCKGWAKWTGAKAKGNSFAKKRKKTAKGQHIFGISLWLNPYHIVLINKFIFPQAFTIYCTYTKRIGCSLHCFCSSHLPFWCFL